MLRRIVEREEGREVYMRVRRGVMSILSRDSRVGVSQSMLSKP